MELLYLYIENFRNLKEIGFNFSPEYQFNYDPHKPELTYERNSDVLQNFFGENITNVTGVIGMNGSGKSNLVELICLLTKDANVKFNSGYILMFLNSGKLTMRTNLSHLWTYPNTSQLDPEKNVPDLSVIYFSNVTDNKRVYFPDEIIDLSRKSYYKTIGRTFVSETRTQVNFMFSKYRELVDLETPRRILISARPLKANTNAIELTRPFPVFHKIFLRLRKIKLDDESSIVFKCSFRFTVLYYIIRQVWLHLDSKNPSRGHSLNYSPLSKTLDNNLTEIADLRKLNHQLADCILEMMNDFKDIVPLSQSFVNHLLRFDHYIEELTPEFTFDPGKRTTQFAFVLNERNQEIFKQFTEIFAIQEMFDLEWEGLSSGHEAFLNLFSQLHSAIHRVSQHGNVLICIDEADLYLHPQWQRQFLDLIVKFVPNIIRRNLQIIITTHSPFLVSDLPRQNLIMLSATDQGKIRNLTGQDTLDRTFGANIIDLFLGPFFLDQGTISEFSLGKIKKVIDITKKVAKTPEELHEARYISNLIGDELIRKRLLEMLDDKA